MSFFFRVIKQYRQMFPLYLRTGRMCVYYASLVGLTFQQCWACQCYDQIRSQLLRSSVLIYSMDFIRGYSSPLFL